MYKSLWYLSLIKPKFAPPDTFFAPVWTILYAMLVLSLMFYVYTCTVKSKKHGYAFFITQMILNLAWSPIFFLMKNIELALLVVLLLDIFVILTIIQFYKISKISAYLLIPYLLWILFATYLNAGYCVLN